MLVGRCFLGRVGEILACGLWGCHAVVFFQLKPYLEPVGELGAASDL